MQVLAQVLQLAPVLALAKRPRERAPVQLPQAPVQEQAQEQEQEQEQQLAQAPVQLQPLVLDPALLQA
jgi:hypothetical protein